VQLVEAFKCVRITLLRQTDGIRLGKLPGFGTPHSGHSNRLGRTTTLNAMLPLLLKLSAARPELTPGPGGWRRRN